jgi:adenylate cyclase
VHSNDYWLGTTKSRQGSIEQAIKWAQKAVALDDSSVEGHSILSVLYNQKREYGKSMAEVQRAMALNPSGAGPIYVYAYNLVNEGRSKEAIPLFQQALRLNPYCPPNWHHNFGHALWFAQRFAEAVPQFKKVIQLVPNHNTAHAWLAITYLMLGRETEARAEAEEHLRINPKFSVDTFAKTRVYKEQSETDRLVAAMRRVGLK